MGLCLPLDHRLLRAGFLQALAREAEFVVHASGLRPGDGLLRLLPRRLPAVDGDAHGEQKERRPEEDPLP